MPTNIRSSDIRSSGIMHRCDCNYSIFDYDIPRCKNCGEIPTDDKHEFCNGPMSSLEETFSEEDSEDTIFGILTEHDYVLYHKWQLLKEARVIEAENT